ncbi:hypothetical protein ASC95_26475 [Pelomonas sp. Root1217]|nr:hypothetical protein ASC95_26475 [Pelomonas sp. Root1217]
MQTVDAQLLHWLKESRRWRELSVWNRAQLRWRSTWATINRRLSEARVVQAPPLVPPLLIVGPWRSGTTVMHELLTAATGLPTPLTWQCMNASAFQLLPAPPQRSGVARPMDGLEISALSPQEDEFALLTLGVDSAYRGFLMPERLPELRHTLDPAYWEAKAHHWMPRFERFLAGVLATGGHAGQRLILKSPNHTFRLPALLRRFPEAQVIWMARDASTVFHSNVKMWRAMFAEHQLTPGPEQGLEDFLGEALRSSADVLNQLRTSGLPAQRWVICRQTELAARPRETLRHVMDALNLPLARPDALETALARVGQGRIDHYTAALPEPARQGTEALDRAQAEAPA